MTLRKAAAGLAVTGLLAALFSSGIAAQFTDLVTATETISVASFECKITAASEGATIALDGKSVTYDAPDIYSSAPGSAPFSFTVTATGDIAAKLHVTHTDPGAPFWADDLPDVVVDADEGHAYNAGLRWGELGNGDQGTTRSVTYNVSCGDPLTFTTFGPATVTEDPAGTYTIVSAGTVNYPPYGEITPFGGIVLTGQSSGKHIGDVDFSFVSSGDVGGGAPRFSLPISTDGSGNVAYYAFLDVNGCGGTTVSTTSATCTVTAGADGTFANWDAFVAAHPTYQIAPGHVPFIVVDGSNGTFVVSNIVES